MNFEQFAYKILEIALPLAFAYGVLRTENKNLAHRLDVLDNELRELRKEIFEFYKKHN